MAPIWTRQNDDTTHDTTRHAGVIRFKTPSPGGAATTYVFGGIFGTFDINVSFNGYYAGRGT